MIRRAYVKIGDKQQFFPNRRLTTVEYSIEETYQGLYEQIRKHIGTKKTDDNFTAEICALWSVALC